ncbi:hypothetical protein [Alkalihalophilus marmarensis]|uniref:hypothetical protein n=1 Tax=Alkalihalophilus marmarensis TaxID=521377 RepID=UPI002DB87876|nr:hypothetical protein [Alkalihalophilus marmarensis]MEC2074168.1 hypothetical protein [Alkalihalophilus marmarensis]
MKKVLFLGSRDKTDLVMYVGQVLSKLDLRVLIVDGTEKEKHVKTYNAQMDHRLTDFHGVDIVPSAGSKKNLEATLKVYKESLSTYDVVIYDLDQIAGLEGWEEFSHRIYVTDYSKLTLRQDKEIFNYYATKFDDMEFTRVVFEVDSSVDEFYIDQSLDYKPKWTALDYFIPLDDRDEANKINMHYDMIPSLKKLTRPYKSFLASFISVMNETHTKDVKISMKTVERSVS